MSPRTARTLAEIAFAVTTQQIEALSTSLDAARLARAAACTRLHDEHGLSYSAIAAMQPGLTRQRVEQLVKLGRKHIEQIESAGR